ncbi:MAG: HRDC domain-containing protein, partial [Spirochaetes bacterium]|nr:HRDC domain-containing protein [Spirochaetota bacterium]
RKTLAEDRKVPPYVIFPDRTLKEMAIQKPVSLEGLSEIHGVGQSKLEKYGSAFLEILRKH